MVASNTQKSYRVKVHRFVEWCQKNGAFEVQNIKAKHIEQFMKWLREKGYKEATIHVYFMAVKHFIEFAERRELIDKNPCQFIEAPRVQVVKKRALTDKEIGSILAFPGTSTRDKTIIHLFYTTGMRVGELCNLQLSDITDKGIMVRESKSNPRMLPLTEYMRKLLNRWINGERKCISRANVEPWLFPNPQGNAISRSSIWGLCKVASARVGLVCSPHDLRHACATHMLEGGASLAVIQAILGHKSLSATQKYLDVTTTHLEEVHTKTHPANNYKDEENED